MNFIHRLSSIAYEFMDTDKEIAQFELEDGTKFLVEVEEPESSSVERVAIDTGRMVVKAKQSFEEALDNIKPVTAAIVDQLRDLSPHETEVKFGIKLTADAGAIFTSIGGEVTFEITVKWSNDPSS